MWNLGVQTRRHVQRPKPSQLRYQKPGISRAAILHIKKHEWNWHSKKAVGLAASFSPYDIGNVVGVPLSPSCDFDRPWLHTESAPTQNSYQTNTRHQWQLTLYRPSSTQSGHYLILTRSSYYQLNRWPSSTQSGHYLIITCSSYYQLNRWPSSTQSGHYLIVPSNKNLKTPSHMSAWKLVRFSAPKYGWEINRSILNLVFQKYMSKTSTSKNNWQAHRAKGTVPQAELHAKYTPT